VDDGKRDRVIRRVPVEMYLAKKYDSRRQGSRPSQGSEGRPKGVKRFRVV